MTEKRLRARSRQLPPPQRTIRTARLTEENVEAVAALDLHSQYDEDIAERDRCQRAAYADDVAAAIAQVLRQSKKRYPIYELAGPRVYSYEDSITEPQNRLLACTD